MKLPTVTSGYVVNVSKGGYYLYYKLLIAPPPLINGFAAYFHSG